MDDKLQAVAQIYFDVEDVNKNDVENILNDIFHQPEVNKFSHTVVDYTDVYTEEVIYHLTYAKMHLRPTTNMQEFLQKIVDDNPSIVYVDVSTYNQNTLSVNLALPRYLRDIGADYLNYRLGYYTGDNDIDDSKHVYDSELLPLSCLRSLKR